MSKPEVSITLTESQVRWLHTLMVYIERCCVRPFGRSDLIKATVIRNRLKVQACLRFRIPRALGGKEGNE